MYGFAVLYARAAVARIRKKNEVLSQIAAPRELVEILYKILSQGLLEIKSLLRIQKMKTKKRLLIAASILLLAVLLYVVVTPFLAPSIAPPIIDADPDNDGLSNKQEKEIGTDPARFDTDNDGLGDGFEVKNCSTDPRASDTDLDDLNDYAEIFTYGTNPLAWDSDDDELKDGLEVNAYGTNPLVADTDVDNLKDGLEVNGWWISVDGSQHHVTSSPLSGDSDGDYLSDWDEYAVHLTNPSSSDTDTDGLPDKWEIDYVFAPASSHDASKDPDYDGLTNLQEYWMGTITKGGALSYQKELFIEIDYMSGYAPSTNVINYFTSYYGELNIYVHVTVDDELSWSQLTAIGVSPDSLTPHECYSIEENFHDNPTTHVYVFYAKALRDPDTGKEPLGWASEFGAFIHKEAVNSMEGLNVLWLTDRIRAEKVVLLHEVGHTVDIIKRTPDGEEDYCSKLGCIMAGADSWWDIMGAISQFVVFWSNTPRYCDEHAALIDLRYKWSVDEAWIS